MNINWLVRIKNKTFWITMIPAILVLITQIAEMFGFKLDLNDLQEQLKSIVETVFLILTILGIVVDPTTKGIADSSNALSYTAPSEN